MLPTTIKEVMDALNLTKMPTNVRANQLQKYGLLYRRKGEGLLETTERGCHIKKVIQKLDRELVGITDGKITLTPIYQCQYSACKDVQAFIGRGEPHCATCGKPLTESMIIDYISATPKPKWEEKPKEKRNIFKTEDDRFLEKLPFLKKVEEKKEKK